MESRRPSYLDIVVRGRGGVNPPRVVYNEPVLVTLPLNCDHHDVILVDLHVGSLDSIRCLIYGKDTFRQ